MSDKKKPIEQSEKAPHAEIPKRIYASVIALILLVPLVAMQFTSEVSWNAADFIAAGGLLLTTAAGHALASRYVHTRRQRIVVSVVVLLALLIVWAELAVGVVT